MYDKKRQAIIQCWNETPQEEKKELMFRYIADHSDDYSVDLWLQFVSRELEVERLEEDLGVDRRDHLRQLRTCVHANRNG